MQFEYAIYKILPKAFLLELDNVYDLGMIFLRAQERYECSNHRFIEHGFTLLEYMDWYAKAVSDDKAFTYGSDYYGFNLPSWAIRRCYNSAVQDVTPYDEFMIALLNYLDKLSDGGDYYVIGVQRGDKETFNHEMAHVYYFSNEQYKQKMDALVDQLAHKEVLFETLEKGFGYHNSVHYDEVQAFMSTGLVDEMGFFEPFRPKFIEVFQSTHKGFTLPPPLKTDVVDFFPKNNI